MNFTFAYKFLLLLLLPVAAWVYLKYKKGTPALTHSLTHRLARISGTNKLIGRLPLILRSSALALLVLTSARPQMYNVSRDDKSLGVDIILTLDTSFTMAALDFELNGQRVTRLAAVQNVVNDFIKKREYDRIGLVVFGAEAYTQSPLTMDKGLLYTLVEKLEIGMAGEQTAIGSAIAVSGKRLKDLDAKSKILILLTDGRNNAGEISPEQAADAVRAFGVKIYTIGVGGKGRAPVQVGNRIGYIDDDLDESGLKKIAEIGNGRYFRASNTKELAEIYDIIDKAEKRKIDVKEFFNYKELYIFFLVPALLLLLAEIIIRTMILRVIP